jgi:O-acetyl-ADP-ribose deacetylase (regulator of RNase III)
MLKLKSRINLVQGDITQLDVDAVVTAANVALRGGAGVDGAIHAAAGPELVVASRALAPCPTGEARMTAGFRLRAPHVIHAVGPIYRDGTENEDRLLADAYRNSLRLATECGLDTIAFPCISTGIYGFPKPEACVIAIETVVDWLKAHASPHRVTFCCFDDYDFSLYAAQLKVLGVFS